MIVLSFGMRLSIGITAIVFSMILFFMLLNAKKKYYNIRLENAILNNSGSKCDGEHSFYKEPDFFAMVNDGDNLCTDDIDFEFNDYCGICARMYYEDEVQ